MDGDGYISKEELKNVIESCLTEYKLNFSFLKSEIQTLVDETFNLAKTEKAGKMNLKEYKSLVLKSPESMMQNMTVTESTTK